MNEPIIQSDVQVIEELAADSQPGDAAKSPWETPMLEDVSEQVMAQPYIRFT